MPAHNERFGATAAGRADLKGSAGMPPLRQAAIPLEAMQRKASSSEYRTENRVQPDNKVKTVPRTEYSPTMKWNTAPRIEYRLTKQ